MKRVVVSVMLFVSALMIFTCGFGEKKEIMTNEVIMTAQVNEVGEKIEVEVIESPYTSGVHLVITCTLTEYTDSEGNEISRSDIKEGDVVKITYSGQVMLSYPPQILALKIVKQ